MMTDKLNSGLINAMKEKIPDGTNLANILMDVLYIGKEAVYRRLRGEVPFTLAESVMISRKLGISLDKLIGASFTNNALFDLNFVGQEDPVESYYTIMEGYMKAAVQAQENGSVEFATASNVLSQTLYLRYEALARFRLFKILYQFEKCNSNRCFEDLNLPEKIIDTQKEFVNTSRSFEKNCYIWDNQIFEYMIKDIQYFSSIQLIEEKSIQLLKQELMALLDELETFATKGRFDTGQEVDFYISHINFDATYSFLESKNQVFSFIRLFTISSITSQDRNVFHNVKDWIFSLKKFSTLISQSGEMQRIQFFKKQRELVNKL